MRTPPTVSPEREASLVDACSDFARERAKSGARSSDSEDDAQNACVRALELRAPQEVREPFRYLLRIARNLFVDRVRKQKRETMLFNSLSAVHADALDTADPERILAGRQKLQSVLTAIGRLPPRCREAFVLHRFHGLSYAATARRMGVSTSMVEKHIAEAMLRILNASREDGES